MIFNHKTMVLTRVMVWRVSLLLSLFVLSIKSNAQVYYEESPSFSSKEKNALYFLMPTVGIHWGNSTLNGDSPFLKTTPSNLITKRFGFLAGYQRSRLTLEIGLTTISATTGYRFVNEDNFMVGSSVRITYWQFPFQGQYLLWQPTKHIQLKAVAGLAWNEERGENLLSPRVVGVFSWTNASGQTSKINTTQQTEYRSHFGSANLGFVINYRLSTRLDLMLQVTRLLSNTQIVSQDLQIEPTSNPSPFRATTYGSVNGYNSMIGLVYRLAPPLNRPGKF